MIVYRQISKWKLICKINVIAKSHFLQCQKRKITYVQFYHALCGCLFWLNYVQLTFEFVFASQFILPLNILLLTILRCKSLRLNEVFQVYRGRSKKNQHHRFSYKFLGRKEEIGHGGRNSNTYLCWFFSPYHFLDSYCLEGC